MAGLLHSLPNAPADFDENTDINPPPSTAGAPTTPLASFRSVLGFGDEAHQPPIARSSAGYSPFRTVVDDASISADRQQAQAADQPSSGNRTQSSIESPLPPPPTPRPERLGISAE